MYSSGDGTPCLLTGTRGLFFAAFSHLFMNSAVFFRGSLSVPSLLGCRDITLFELPTMVDGAEGFVARRESRCPGDGSWETLESTPLPIISPRGAGISVPSVGEDLSLVLITSLPFRRHRLRYFGGVISLASASS